MLHTPFPFLELVGCIDAIRQLGLESGLLPKHVYNLCLPSDRGDFLLVDTYETFWLSVMLRAEHKQSLQTLVKTQCLSYISQTHMPPSGPSSTS